MEMGVEHRVTRVCLHNEERVETSIKAMVRNPPGRGSENSYKSQDYNE